jgi:hypothetical protein
MAKLMELNLASEYLVEKIGYAAAHDFHEPRHFGGRQDILD